MIPNLRFDFPASEVNCVRVNRKILKLNPCNRNARDELLPFRQDGTKSDWVNRPGSRADIRSGKPVHFFHAGSQTVKAVLEVVSHLAEGQEFVEV
jgi:hypothetical protein